MNNPPLPNMHQPSIGKTSISPISMLRSLVTHRVLILRMARRELEARFRGSRLGLLWIVLQPLLMLVVYTFAFGIILRARWSQDTSGSPWDYALFLFIGLLAFNVFSEIVGRAPTLMLENTGFIKNMVFPTEILPVVTVVVAFFNFGVGFIILLLLHLIQRGLPAPTTVLIFLPLIPLGFLGLGLGWFLSALGVYLRDLRQIVGILIAALMFLSPLFYPLSTFPEQVRLVISLNPLATIIETMRDFVFFNRMPDWQSYGLGVMTSFGIAWLGYAWFIKTRKGFADVI